MDEFAKRSQDLASANVENGFFEDEITPLTLAGRHASSPRTTARAQARRSRALAGLKPVFRPDGQVTAGNACPLNDGAAAVLVMSADKAASLGLTPLARVVASGVSGLNPEIMGLGPIEAVPPGAQAGRHDDRRHRPGRDQRGVRRPGAPVGRVSSASRWRSSTSTAARIALGHPFGMTGARIMTTLIHGLQHADKTFGLETMCVGGGQGMAMIVERLS